VQIPPNEKTPLKKKTTVTRSRGGTGGLSEVSKRNGEPGRSTDMKSLYRVIQKIASVSKINSSWPGRERLVGKQTALNLKKQSALVKNQKNLKKDSKQKNETLRRKRLQAGKSGKRERIRAREKKGNPPLKKKLNNKRKVGTNCPAHNGKKK